jgi:hypothetical protein
MIPNSEIVALLAKFPEEKAAPAVQSLARPSDFAEALARERAYLIWVDASPRATDDAGRADINARVAKAKADDRAGAFHDPDLLEFLARSNQLNDTSWTLYAGSTGDAWLANALLILEHGSPSGGR